MAVSHTWGSETSQYPKEKKAKAIPGVVANETGEAQTKSLSLGVVGPKYGSSDVRRSFRKAAPKRVKGP